MRKHHVATMLVWVSFAANALCDRIIFTHAYMEERINFWWHVLKWLVDKPCLFVAGILFYNTLFTYYKLLKHNTYWWAWHYPQSIKWLVTAIIGGFALWNVTYWLSGYWFLP